MTREEVCDKLVRSIQRSMRVRAMDMAGGIMGRSSGRYQPASTISTPSIAMSPEAQVASNPIMSEWGKGHGWLAM